LTFDPPDLIEKAARAEGWTASDWRHWEKMRTLAFEEAFDVKQIQRTGIGLIAYDSRYSNFESVLFEEHAEKPTLSALGDLSRKLLNVKGDRA
jgi:hypothetical protein